MNILFNKRSGALIYAGDPTEVPPFFDSDIRQLVIKENALFARWPSGLTLDSNNHNINFQNKGWWYCIKTDAVSLESLSAKQRYRVKKGLKNNTFWIASEQDFEKLFEELYQSFLDSIADYPAEYKILPKKEETLGWIRGAIKSDMADIWFCRDNETNNLVGFAHCRIKNNAIEMSSVKLNPKYFKSEVNAGLAYAICEYYLKSGKYKYICDGERNIIHQTAYQDFLVSVVGFQKVHCKLNIIYHPLLKPIISILYPYRKTIKKISCRNHFLYKAYCLLFQEQCARESRLL